MSLDALRSISLEQIHLSQTTGQVERRKHFDKAALVELADSIKEVGLLAPLIVRPVKMIQTTGLNGTDVAGKTYFSPSEAQRAAETTFELVAGERRYMAARTAGLEEVPVSVRELTDEQVLEVQLIENLQREGLHELAEAEGYEQLHKLGHSAEEIADKVGKSKAYVYARMKLLALSASARKAFYEGDLNASTALLIARIPVESLQKQALQEITKGRWSNGPMSYREALEHVQNNYMLALGGAGFKTDDATLLPAAGTCGACPKRTGNQPELFGDVKRADACTDPVCFKAKRDAHARREIARAEEEGRRVITGKEAKKVFPYSGEHPHGGYVALDDKPYEDPKNRTVAQLLGKDYEPVLVQHPETGKLFKVAPQSAVNAALKDAGVKRSSSSGSGTQSAAEKKAKAERAFRKELFAKVREKYPKSLGRADWNDLAIAIVGEMQNEARKQLMALWSWEPVKEKYGQLDYTKTIKANVPKLSGEDIARFFLDCIFVSDMQVSTWSDRKPEVLLAGAKRYGVNAEQVRRTLNSKTVPAAKKAAKKK